MGPPPQRLGALEREGVVRGPRNPWAQARVTTGRDSSPPTRLALCAALLSRWPAPAVCLSGSLARWVGLGSALTASSRGRQPAGGRRLLRPPAGAESKSVAEGGKPWSPVHSTRWAVAALTLPNSRRSFLSVRPFLFGWEKSQRAGSEPVDARIIAPPWTTVFLELPTIFFVGVGPRRPPAPPNSMLVGGIVSWVVQSTRALARPYPAREHCLTGVG